MKNYDVMIGQLGPLNVFADNREQAIEIACDRVALPCTQTVFVMVLDTSTGIAIKYEVARM